MSTPPPGTTIAPTTVAPTTAAPTTIAPTTFLTTVAPTDIYAGPIDLYVTVFNYARIHQFPGAPRDPTLDNFYRLEPIEITITIHGNQLHQWIAAGPIVITLSLEGLEATMGVVIAAGPIVITITPTFYSIIVERKKCNWLQWSKVGYLDFTIDQSNQAGERPVDWKGCIYSILKLVDRVVVYGENGVSFLAPANNAYGLQTIHRIGVMGLQAVVGTDTDHYFVDVDGCLYHLSKEGLELLDYSEFLEDLEDPVLSLDRESNLIYICDGTLGFVYGIAAKSLGSGPPNITGIGNQGGLRYVTSPATITMPMFEICTDIYDMGTRKAKTIQSLEVGTDLTQFLRVRVEYRISNRHEFHDSSWFLVNPDGFAYPTCYGVEFRFRLKATAREALQIDYLHISGILHGYGSNDLYRMSQRT